MRPRHVTEVEPAPLKEVGWVMAPPPGKDFRSELNRHRSLHRGDG
jgi:hypothetical protein